MGAFFPNESKKLVVREVVFHKKILFDLRISLSREKSLSSGGTNPSPVEEQIPLQWRDKSLSSGGTNPSLVEGKIPPSSRGANPSLQ